jgi:hypothetical protein
VIWGVALEVVLIPQCEIVVAFLDNVYGKIPKQHPARHPKSWEKARILDPPRRVIFAMDSFCPLQDECASNCIGRIRRFK